jgi:hypothetical protein
MPDGSRVFLFKVQLQGMPDVWRTIEVRENQTLHHLHVAIQQAFHWDDDHLYSFFLSGKPWDRQTEYASPEAEGARSARARLDSLGLHSGQRFLYLFDYGDELLHDVKVLSINEHPGLGRYPRIVEEHGEAPPQYPALEDDWVEEDEWETGE